MILFSLSKLALKHLLLCNTVKLQVYHREKLDVLEKPAKKFPELCLIFILDVSANQFQKLKHLNLCCNAEQDKQDSERSASLAVFADKYNSKPYQKYILKRQGRKRNKL